MEALTSIALARRWSPALYCRLVNQLRDFANVTVDDAIKVLIDLVCSPASATVDPLLLEYIYTLSADTPASSALLPAWRWIAKWADDGKGDLWKSRDPRLDGLICYVARGWPKWSPDSIAGSEEESFKGVREMTVQAAGGCRAATFLVSELARNGSLDALYKFNGQWKQELRDVCGSNELMLVLQGSPAEDNLEKSTTLSYLPSRTLRLLWMDWLVRSASAVPLKYLKRQLDVNWPQDRTLVVAYEATVTAFDCYASAHEFRKPLWEAFITRKLPLLLEELTKTGEDDRLDGALSRVFTTMDKNLAAVADKAGLRVKLGKVCSDMGLCDPTVLHALHISYTPVPEPEYEIGNESLVELAQKLPELGPRSHQKVAYHLLKSSGLATDSKQVAELCVVFVKTPVLGDQLFIHVPAAAFVHNLLAHSDRTSQKEGVGSASTYADIGKFLLFLLVFVPRYSSLAKLESQTWMWKLFHMRFFSTKGAFVEDLDDQQKRLLNQFILDLYGGSGGGLSDDTLAPTRVLFSVMGTLLLQTATAYAYGIIDQEALESGLDHFTQPFFVTLLSGPLKTLGDLIWSKTQPAAVLEMARILIQYIVSRLEQETYSIAAVSCTPQVEYIIKNAAVVEKEMPNISGVINELKGLAEKLRQHIPNDSIPPAIEFSGSAAETLSQALDQVQTWQTRPAGIPAVPMALVAAAKRVLGGAKTREILAKTGNDVAVAVLAIDTLDTSPCAEKLVDAGGSELQTRLATEFSNKIIEITEEAAIEYAEMVAVEIKPEPVPEPKPDVEPAPAMEQIDITGLSDLPDLGLDAPDAGGLQLDKLDDPTAFGSQDPLAGALDNDMLDEFGYGLDLDQQPMDLAALDNAMNFE